ncbi:hypothetical protein GPECTOR_2g1554 [Gonium pectorale]|uniref:Protein kinase domain-containing protein n=1 Tax=Gonium pectorale TaxID=33097 RepID=A0A150H216_GONPE|nr:hypothetical protein GPECTOR_2g1554 [Gonium pectorale]|eukprot:KXZ56002.1 hypothetical protein GPECTOR_2g1554 [Gonium pectorale]
MRLLGTGATGRVDLVHIPLPGDCSPFPAARKTLLRSRDPHMRAAEDALFSRELAALAAGRTCPFIVKQLAASSHDDRHELLLELAEGNTLEHELSDALSAVRGPLERTLLPPGRLAELAAQLLCALDALHSAGVVHLDVKPLNLLLTARGSLLLGDAGCAQRVTQPGGAVPEPPTGTPLFAAPEAKRRGAPVTAAADLYSVGALLAVAACWHRQTGRVLAFLRGQAALPDFVPAELRDLVSRLVADDPTQRPTAAEALRHPFLAGVDLAALAPVRCEGAAPQ